MNKTVEWRRCLAWRGTSFVGWQARSGEASRRLPMFVFALVLPQLLQDEGCHPVARTAVLNNASGWQPLVMAHCLPGRIYISLVEDYWQLSEFKNHSSKRWTNCSTQVTSASISVSARVFNNFFTEQVDPIRAATASALIMLSCWCQISLKNIPLFASICIVSVKEVSRMLHLASNVILIRYDMAD